MHSDQSLGKSVIGLIFRDRKYDHQSIKNQDSILTPAEL